MLLCDTVCGMRLGLKSHVCGVVHCMGVAKGVMCLNFVLAFI